MTVYTVKFLGPEHALHLAGVDLGVTGSPVREKQIKAANDAHIRLLAGRHAWPEETVEITDPNGKAVPV